MSDNSKQLELGLEVTNPEIKESDVKIYQTSDYSIFTIDEKLNRDVKHTNKVGDSIDRNNLTKYAPILVDDEFKIIDGQGRFSACVLRKLPIYFIKTDEVTIYDAPELNSASTNWSADDYIKHWSNRGVESFQKIEEYAKKYDQSIHTIFRFGKQGNQKGGKKYSYGLVDGSFEFQDGVEEIMGDFFEHYNAFCEYIPFAKHEKFRNALFTIFRHEDYSPARMLKKLMKASGIVKEQPRTTLYVEELEKLYNYKAKSNTVKFQ